MFSNDNFNFKTSRKTQRIHVQATCERGVWTSSCSIYNYFLSLCMYCTCTLSNCALEREWYKSSVYNSSVSTSVGTLQYSQCKHKENPRGTQDRSSSLWQT
jgi:hypothetical protein